MRRNYLMAGIMLAAAALSLSACNSKTEETLAYETATAPETEEANETEAEETTIDASEYETAPVYSTYFAFADWLKQNSYNESEKAPEIGERDKELYFYILPYDENNHTTMFGSDFRTVTLPEWGIERITVDSEIFPDDENNILKLDESKIKKRKLTAEELARIGKAEDEDVEVLYYDGEALIERESYDDIENVCYDLSPLYPGSITRSGEQAFFQVFVTNFNDDINLEETDLSEAELFEKLYPYGSYDYEFSEDIFDYNVFVTDDAKYVVFKVKDLNGNRTAHSNQYDKNTKNNIRNGFCLMRIKDGICQGIMYKTMDIFALEKAPYILGVSLNLYDVNMIKEKPCERYID